MTRKMASKHVTTALDSSMLPLRSKSESLGTPSSDSFFKLLHAEKKQLITSNFSATEFGTLHLINPYHRFCGCFINNLAGFLF